MPIHPSVAKPTEHRDDLVAEIHARRQRVIHPDDNILIGATAICRYLKCSSINTMIRWCEEYGLPLIKTADGKWMTSTTAIDQWIWLASELEAEKRLDNRQRQTIRRIAGISSDVEVKKPYTSSHIERAERNGRTAADVISDSAMRKHIKGWD